MRNLLLLFSHDIYKWYRYRLAEIETNDGQRDYIFGPREVGRSSSH